MTCQSLTDRIGNQPERVLNRFLCAFDAVRSRRFRYLNGGHALNPYPDQIQGIRGNRSRNRRGQLLTQKAEESRLRYLNIFFMQFTVLSELRVDRYKAGDIATLSPSRR